MSNTVTIVISAGGIPARVLSHCLLGISNHPCDTPYELMIVSPEHQKGEVQAFCDLQGFRFKAYPANDDGLSGSALHGIVLDQAVHDVETPFMLTLDADCWPIQPGWLDRLMDMVNEGAAVAGILHPYAPPPDDMPNTSLEYRIRSQLCWDNTHVACQLVRMNTLKRLNVGFADGDDTGLAIPVKAREAGLKVDGWKPTRCLCPFDSDIDEIEMNREMCVIFGDYMYHHGGAGREAQSRGDFDLRWYEIRKMVLDDCSFSWYLYGLLTHRYQFVDEEKVANAMVQRILSGMQTYLQTHNRALKDTK